MEDHTPADYSDAMNNTLSPKIPLQSPKTGESFDVLLVPFGEIKESDHEKIARR